MFSKVKQKLIRGTSLLTLACFLSSQVTFANAGAGIEMTAVRETPGFLQIDIPDELATLDGLYEAPPHANPKFILHVQNAHANFGAQQKIKQLLQYLERSYGMKTLFVEGASEDLNPDYLKMFPDKERNLKLAQFLAEQGELTGAELYLMEQDGATRNAQRVTSEKEALGVERSTLSAPKAHGIENAELYRENYEALKKVFGSEATVKKYLDGFEGRLSGLASKVFPGEMIKLLGEWKKFEKGHREFMPYVRNLSSEAKRVLGIDLESLFAQVEWPQTTRLLVLQTMEKELDTAQGLAERDTLIKFLKEKNVSGKLVSAIENFKDQRLSVMRSGAAGQTGPVAPRDLMEQLVLEAGPKGFRFSDYPNFSLYAGYLILKSELDPKSLFTEIRALFTRILDKWATTQQQKALLALYRDEELVRKLLNLELTRKDWQEVLGREEVLSMDAMVGGLKKIGTSVSQDLNLPLSNFETKPVNPKFKKAVTDVQDAAYRFYEAARKREDVFYEKIDTVMRRDSLTKAVVITGGFHTDGITELLREHEVSYGVLTPRLSEKSDENLYRSVMLQNKASTFELSYLEATSRLMSFVDQSRQLGEDEVIQSLKPILRAIGRAGALGNIVDAINIFNESDYAKRAAIRIVPTSDGENNGRPLFRVNRSEQREKQATAVHLVGVQGSEAPAIAATPAATRSEAREEEPLTAEEASEREGIKKTPSEIFPDELRPPLADREQKTSRLMVLIFLGYVLFGVGYSILNSGLLLQSVVECVKYPWISIGSVIVGFVVGQLFHLRIGGGKSVDAEILEKDKSNRFYYERFVISAPSQIKVWATVGVEVFLEEIVFRFFFFSIWPRTDTILWSLSGLFVSAVLFSMAHHETRRRSQWLRFVNGVVWGGVYLVSGSIVPSSIVHFLNNLYAYYKMKNYYAQEVLGRSRGVFSEDSSNAPTEQRRYDEVEPGVGVSENKINMDERWKKFDVGQAIVKVLVGSNAITVSMKNIFGINVSKEDVQSVQVRYFTSSRQKTYFKIDVGYVDGGQQKEAEFLAYLPARSQESLGEEVHFKTISGVSDDVPRYGGVFSTQVETGLSFRPTQRVPVVFAELIKGENLFDLEKRSLLTEAQREYFERQAVRLLFEIYKKTSESGEPLFVNDVGLGQMMLDWDRETGEWSMKIVDLGMVSRVKNPQMIRDYFSGVFKQPIPGMEESAWIWSGKAEKTGFYDAIMDVYGWTKGSEIIKDVFKYQSAFEYLSDRSNYKPLPALAPLGTALPSRSEMRESGNEGPAVSEREGIQKTPAETFLDQLPQRLRDGQPIVFPFFNDIDAYEPPDSPSRPDAMKKIGAEIWRQIRAICDAVIPTDLTDDFGTDLFDPKENVEKALNHLLGNSVDAIFERIDRAPNDEKGDLIKKAEVQLSVKRNENTGEIVMTLSDNGIGIPLSVLEPLSQGKPLTSHKTSGVYRGKEGVALTEVFGYLASFSYEISITSKREGEDTRQLARGSNGEKVLSRPTEDRSEIGTDVTLTMRSEVRLKPVIQSTTPSAAMESPRAEVRGEDSLEKFGAVGILRERPFEKKLINAREFDAANLDHDATLITYSSTRALINRYLRDLQDVVNSDQASSMEFDTWLLLFERFMMNTYLMIDSRWDMPAKVEESTEAIALAGRSLVAAITQLYRKASRSEQYDYLEKVMRMHVRIHGAEELEKSAEYGGLYTYRLVTDLTKDGSQLDREAMEEMLDRFGARPKQGVFDLTKIPVDATPATFALGPDEGVLADSDKIRTLKRDHESLYNVLFYKENLTKLLNYASFLRHFFDFNESLDRTLSPREFAVQNGLYFPLGKNVYLAPTTQSFRRYLIFEMTGSPEKPAYGKAVEIKVPGLLPRKRSLWKNGYIVSKKIAAAYQDDAKISEDVLAFLESKEPLTMYGREMSFSAENPAGVQVFEYDFDASRQNLVDIYSLFRNWNGRSALPESFLLAMGQNPTQRRREEWKGFVRDIGGQCLEILAKVRALGLYAGTDGRDDNNRLSLGSKGEVIVRLAGDFEDYKKPEDSSLFDWEFNNRIQGLISTLDVDRTDIPMFISKMRETYRNALEKAQAKISEQEKNLAAGRSEMREEDSLEKFGAVGILRERPFKDKLVNALEFDATATDHDGKRISYASKRVALSRYLQDLTDVMNSDDGSKMGFDTWLLLFERFMMNLREVLLDRSADVIAGGNLLENLTRFYRRAPRREQYVYLEKIMRMHIRMHGDAEFEKAAEHGGQYTYALLERLIGGGAALDREAIEEMLSQFGIESSHGAFDLTKVPEDVTSVPFGADENGSVLADEEKISTLKKDHESLYNTLFYKQNLSRLLSYASFLRHFFRFDTSLDRSMSPLEFAVKNGFYFHLGGNVYLAPTTQSFRRYVVFEMTGSKGNPVFGKALEIKVPGLLPRKRDLWKDGYVVSKKIAAAYPGDEKISEDSLAFLELKEPLTLYGQEMSFSVENPAGVQVFEYDFDASRQDLVDIHSLFKKWSENSGLPERRAEEWGRFVREIGSQTLGLLAKVHALRLSPGRDGGDGNNRLGLSPDGKVMVRLAGDFEDYKEPEDESVYDEELSDRIKGLLSTLRVDRSDILSFITAMRTAYRNALEDARTQVSDQEKNLAGGRSEVRDETVREAEKIIEEWRYTSHDGTQHSYKLHEGTMEAVISALESLGESAAQSLENPWRLVKLALIYEFLRGTSKAEELSGKFQSLAERYVAKTVPEAVSVPARPEGTEIIDGLNVSAFFEFGGSILSAMQWAHSHGLTHLETSFDILPFAAGFAPDSISARRLAGEYSPEEIQVIRQFVQATGIQLTIHSPIVGPAIGSQFLFEDAADNLELMKEQVRVAGEMGAIGVVVHLTTLTRARDYAELVLYASKVAPNLKINLENSYDKTPGKKNFPTASRFMSAFEEVFEIVKMKDPGALKNLGIVLDVAHYNLSGEDPVISAYTIAERLRALAEGNPESRHTVMGYLQELHLNQNLGPMEFYVGFSADLHSPVSTPGPIDITGVITVLALQGFYPFATLEQAQRLSPKDRVFMRQALDRAQEIRKEIEAAGGNVESVIERYRQKGEAVLNEPSVSKYRQLFSNEKDPAVREGYALAAGLVGKEAFSDHMQRRVYQKLFSIRSAEEYRALERAGLTGKARLRPVAPGKEILTQGEMPDPDLESTGSPVVYLIVKGAVSVFVSDPETLKVWNALNLITGKIFGERSALKGEAPNATVVARDNTLILELPILEIEKLMPDIRHQLLGINAQREAENADAAKTTKRSEVRREEPEAMGSGLPVSADQKTMAVSGLVDVLKLDQVEILSKQVMEVEVYQGLKKVPRPLTVFKIQLPAKNDADVADLNGHPLWYLFPGTENRVPGKFELIYNDKSQLIAIFPEPQDISARFQYVDLSDYYIPVEKLKTGMPRDELSAEKGFLKDIADNKKLIMGFQQYRNYISKEYKPYFEPSYSRFSGKAIEGFKKGTYIYAELDLEKGVRVKYFDPLSRHPDYGSFSLVANEFVDFPSQVGKIKIIFPIFPSVYSSASSEVAFADAFTFRTIHDRMATFEFKDGDNVLDSATGPGLILWIEHEIAKSRGLSLNYYAYDRNPVAIANAKTFLNAIAGIPVHLKVSGDIAAFGEGLKFNFISANGPAQGDYGKVRTAPPEDFFDLHDAGLAGESYAENLGFRLSRVLATNGIALVWEPVFGQKHIKLLERNGIRSKLFELKDNISPGTYVCQWGLMGKTTQFLKNNVLSFFARGAPSDLKDQSEPRDEHKRSEVRGLEFAAKFAATVLVAGMLTLPGVFTASRVGASERPATPSVAQVQAQFDFPQLWQAVQHQGLLKGVTAKDLRDSISFSEKQTAVVKDAIDLLVQKNILPEDARRAKVVFLSGIALENYKAIRSGPESFAMAFIGLNTVLVDQGAYLKIPAGERAKWLAIKIAHEIEHILLGENVPILVQEAKTYAVTLAVMKALGDGTPEEVDAQERVAQAFEALSKNPGGAVTTPFGLRQGDLWHLNYDQIALDPGMTRVRLYDWTKSDGKQIMFGVDGAKKVFELIQHAEPSPGEGSSIGSEARRSEMRQERMLRKWGKAFLMGAVLVAGLWGGPASWAATAKVPASSMTALADQAAASANAIVRDVMSLPAFLFSEDLFADNSSELSWFKLTGGIEVKFVTDPPKDFLKAESVTGEGKAAVYHFRLPKNITLNETLGFIKVIQALPNGVHEDLILPEFAQRFMDTAVLMAQLAMAQAGEIDPAQQALINGFYGVGQSLAVGAVEEFQSMKDRTLRKGMDEKIFQWLGLSAEDRELFKKAFGRKEDAGAAMKKLDFVNLLSRLAIQAVTIELKYATYFKGIKDSQQILEKKLGWEIDVAGLGSAIARAKQEHGEHSKEAVQAELDAITAVLGPIHKLPGWVESKGKKESTLESAPASIAFTEGEANCVGRSVLTGLYLEPLGIKMWNVSVHSFSKSSSIEGYGGHQLILVQLSDGTYRWVEPSTSSRVRIEIAHLSGKTIPDEGGILDALEDPYLSGVDVRPFRKGTLASFFNNLGSALFFARDSEGAIQSYRDAIALDPLYQGAYNNMGFVLGDQLNWDEAIGAYGEAIRLNPGYSDALIGRGNVFYAKGENGKAREDYEKAIELAPQYSLAHYKLGVVLDAAGDSIKALSQFEKFLELAHGDPALELTLRHAEEMITKLKKTSSETPSKVSAAEKHARSDVRQAPEQSFAPATTTAGKRSESRTTESGESQEEIWRRVFEQELKVGLIKKEYEISPSAKALVESGALKKGAKILVIGSWMGYDDLYFAENGFDVTSTDVIEAPLKRIQEKAQQQELHWRIRARLLNLEQSLQFPAQAYDVVFSHLSAHYIDDDTLRQRLAELWRSLKPGGRIIMTGRSVFDKKFTSATQREGIFVIDKDGKKQRFFETQDMKRFLGGMFSDISFREIPPYERYLSQGPMHTLEVSIVKHDTDPIASQTGYEAIWERWNEAFKPFETKRGSAEEEIRKLLHAPSFEVQAVRDFDPDKIREDALRQMYSPEVFESWLEYLKLSGLGGEDLRGIALAFWDGMLKPRITLAIDGKKRVYSGVGAQGGFDTENKYVFINLGSESPQNLIVYHEFSEAMMRKFKAGFEFESVQAKEYAVDLLTLKMLTALERSDLVGKYQHEVSKRLVEEYPDLSDQDKVTAEKIAQGIFDRAQSDKVPAVRAEVREAQKVKVVEAGKTTAREIELGITSVQGVLKSMKYSGIRKIVQDLGERASQLSAEMQVTAILTWGLVRQGDVKAAIRILGEIAGFVDNANLVKQLQKAAPEALLEVSAEGGKAAWVQNGFTDKASAERFIRKLFFTHLWNPAADLRLLVLGGAVTAPEIKGMIKAIALEFGKPEFSGRSEVRVTQAKTAKEKSVAATFLSGSLVSGTGSAFETLGLDPDRINFIQFFEEDSVNGDPRALTALVKAAQSVNKKDPSEAVKLLQAVAEAPEQKSGFVYMQGQFRITSGSLFSAYKAVADLFRAFQQISKAA